MTTMGTKKETEKWSSRGEGLRSRSKDLTVTQINNKEKPSLLGWSQGALVAMLYAQQCAQEADAPLAVCFSLVEEYLGAGLRQFGFMLRGLKEVEAECSALNIPFYLLRGQAQDTLPKFVEDHKVGLVVTDYSPIRITRQWREGVGACIQPVPLHEVDAHNIVPVWEASPKQEVGARTLRPKITKLLPVYLTDFPNLALQPI